MTLQQASYLISVIVVVMCAASTALNVLYYVKFRRIGLYAKLRLANALVTAYTMYAHISVIVQCSTAQVALMISTCLMVLQMLIWSVINYYYLDTHPGDTGQLF